MPQTRANPPLAPRIEPPSRLFTSMRHVWPWAWRTFHRDYGLRGLSDLARFNWHEWTFDRRYGVRTEYRVPPAELGFDNAELEAESSRYRATPPFPVMMALQRLSERLGGLEGEGMVDYGSGAGRIMILGAEAGVGKAIGLEYSPHLVAQSRDNLARYTARTGTTTQFEVLQVDATRFVPPPDTRLFYFFNPFTGEAFARALDHIRQSVRAHPRTIYVLAFMSPTYRLEGLDLVGSVTGVQTYTNGLDPEGFLGGGCAPQWQT